MVKLKYLLDTNICIYLMDEHPVSVIQKFAKCQPGEIAISAITWAELCCGMDTHDGKNEMLGLLGKLMPQDFCIDAGAIFGELSQRFPSRKSSFDRMIAAHALALNVTLVTNNPADFEIYQSAGLTLENWAPALQ
ncbi:MAG: type II toxin-antitoxin system VapC family toxin [Burkholderiaceae bacterium]|jgi:tRNA(fMet)-specific endonuclease VapC|nr:type II toxin-antitoxin system VapC family toxin [Burkholderiaceae bacterium]